MRLFTPLINWLARLFGKEAQHLPLSEHKFPALGDLPTPSPLILATSAQEQNRYQAQVEGTLPADLNGSLYRNGPGQFDRSGLRRRFLLEGDGLIQAYHFSDGQVDYQSRFVRTEKFVKEERAQKALYATWGTMAPGGLGANLMPGANWKTTAGVSVWKKYGKLYAFDEMALPYELDPQTLETKGMHNFTPSGEQGVYSAHPKHDPKTGQWCHFGLKTRKSLTLQLTVLNADQTVYEQRDVPCPRYVYVHDFFLTEHYFIFILHPAFIKIPSFLLGQTSFKGCFQWRPEEGNCVMVIPRDSKQPVKTFEAPAAWMWHSLNAYEREHEIVMDFAAFDHPDAIIGEDCQLNQIMQGVCVPRKNNAHLRRYTLDLQTTQLHEDIVDKGDYEFPALNIFHTAREHRYGYFARCTRPGEIFWGSVVRVDYQTGTIDEHDFGPGNYVGEPVFCTTPGYEYRLDKPDEPGYLLVQVAHGQTKTSSLAILRANALADGPVAWVRHPHHIPLSFHGAWAPRQG